MNIHPEALKAIHLSLQARGVENVCPSCHSIGTLNLEPQTLSLLTETGIVQDFIIMQCTNCFNTQFFLAIGYNLSMVVSNDDSKGNK